MVAEEEDWSLNKTRRTTSGRIVASPASRRFRLPRPWPAAHPWHQLWTTALTVLGLYSAFTTPFRLAFAGADLENANEPDWNHFNSFGLFIDIVFVFDMVISATCVLPEGVAKASRPQIAWEFFRSGHLLRDLTYAVPWDYIAAAGGASVRLVFAIGLLRLLRLRLTFRALSEAEAEARMPYAMLRFFRFTVMLSLEAHCFACCFFYLGKTEEGAVRNWLEVAGSAKPDGAPHTMWKQYLFSLYWSCTTLTSIGYGDVTPQTYPEIMLTISYMLINYCISVYIIGNMTILTTQADAETRKFRKQLSDAEAFMDAYQLPPAMQRHLRGVLTLRFNDAQEHREVLDSLPPALRRRVAANLYRPLIERAYIFRGLPSDDAFVGVFATSLVVELFMPFVSILTQGNPALELFFVASGTAIAVMSGRDGGGIDTEPIAEDEADAMAAEEADVAAATRVRRGEAPQSSASGGEGGPLAAARSALAACLPRSGQKRARNLDRSATDLEADASSHGWASSVVHNLREGDCFGEVAFVFSLPQPWGVRTTSLARMLFIRHDFWERVRGARPHDARELAGRISEAVARRAVQADADAAAAVAAGAPRAPAAVRVAQIYSGLARKVRGKVAQREREAAREAANAAAAGDVAGLRRVLASGVSPGAADADGRTPLHVAAAKGQPDAIRYLLSRGADVNVSDADGVTPLFDAVRCGHLELAAMLRAAGAQLGLPPGWQHVHRPRDASHGSASSGAATSSASSEEGAPMQPPAEEVSAAAGHIRQLDEGTLLCQTVMRENGALLSSLLSAGIDPDAADHCGRTGLHEGAAGGHTGAVATLLAAGADPNVHDRWGVTPLFEAVRGRHEASAATLRAAGGRLGLRHEGHELTRLAAGNDAEVALLLRLLRHGADPDARNFDSRTAAHVACAAGAAALAVELHAAGADFGARDRYGRTPTDEAERGGHAGLVSALRALPPAVPFAEREGANREPHTQHQQRMPSPAPAAKPPRGVKASAAALAAVAVDDAAPAADAAARKSLDLMRQGSVDAFVAEGGIKAWFAPTPSSSPPPPGAPGGSPRSPPAA